MFFCCPHERGLILRLLVMCMPQYQCLRKQTNKKRPDLLHLVNFNGSMFICLHLSPSMSENPLESQILHAAPMPYDSDMANMHVCILALSQVTIQCAVCMLCNGIIMQPPASGSWSCLYTTTLFTPPLWLLIHSSYLPSQNCMPCPKPTCYEDTQGSCKSPSCEGISLACAFMMSRTVSLSSKPARFLLLSRAQSGARER